MLMSQWEDGDNGNRADRAASLSKTFSRKFNSNRGRIGLNLIDTGVFQSDFSL